MGEATEKDTKKSIQQSEEEHLTTLALGQVCNCTLITALCLSLPETLVSTTSKTEI